MNKIHILLLLIPLIMAACSPKATRVATYAQLYEEKPVSIMIMPPINKSTEVDAKMCFYNTLAMPLADYGYYALPPSISMQVMKDQSAYNSEMLLDKSMKVVNTALGADAVLFTIIHEWRKVTIGSMVEVKIEYLIKSTKTNEVLYNRTGIVKVQSSSNTGNIFADLAVMMIKTAFTKEVTVARACNDYTFTDIPRGKYSILHGKDQQSPAGEKEFSVTLSQ
ncbi:MULTISPECIES: GNA1162 family protein [unclassified Carboxylicivirga]|uniref:GNA1162 family protein n=1 Tax=Carboxylicivirga TaxID=1628153 RepID=UPI003D33E470